MKSLIGFFLKIYEQRTYYDELRDYLISNLHFTLEY